MTQFNPPPIDNPQTFYDLTNKNLQASTATTTSPNNLTMSTSTTNHHLSSMSNLLKNSRLQPKLSPSNNATTSYSLSLTDDSLPEEIKEILNVSSFIETSKAFDMWFTNLDQFEQVTAFCLMLNRLNSNHYPFVKDVINKQSITPNWLKNQLPEFSHNNRESRSIEVDALSKLMEALSTDANQLQPIGRSNRSIYRNSQPVPIDFTRLKARFDPFPDSFLENDSNLEVNTPTNFNSGQASKLNASLTPSLLGPVDTLPVSPIARTRPKSMFEPGMGSIGWKSEQSSPRINGHSRLAPTNPTATSGVDSVTWAVPISPNYNQYASNTMPVSSRPIGFTRSEDQIPRSHLGLSSSTVDYGGTNGYQTYQPNSATLGNSMQSAMNSRFKPSSNSNNRNNRRSYDYSNSKENASDFFTQGYRHVLGKMPSSIKNHLIKPSNRVDFDLLQDIPAWLRSLRLHKYTKHFDGMVWQDVIQLTDEGLFEKGVVALGARRKMLKHFELIKQELNAKNKVMAAQQ